MARWRLAGPHYLRVKGTEWEYKETDQTTGKQKRVVMPVPLFLDPDDPADRNYPDEVIVSNGSGAQSRDIIFEGEPTPDMVPLDEEAQAISDSLAQKWKHPIESLSGTYGDKLIEEFEAKLKLSEKVAQQAAPSNEMEQLLSAMTAMMKQNQEIIAQLTGNPVPQPEPEGKPGMTGFELKERQKEAADEPAPVERRA